jgi:hypothetical protein
MIPTSFTEANALLAVVRDDDDAAHRILSVMSDAELTKLRNAATVLAFFAHEHIAVKDALTGRTPR